jgi:hypothetical protein
MKFKGRDFWRPIFGLVALQPLTIFWCHLFNISYLENLGLFSIICTIYLMPIYAWYERKCDRLEIENTPVGWPY